MANLGKLNIAVDIGWFDPRNAEIGTFMELGTDTVPARPSLEPGLREASPRMHRIMAQIVKAAEAGKSTTGLVEQLGEAGVEGVKNYIKGVNIPPPLADSTVKAKGSNHALIDTGELVNSVSYRVKNTKV